MLTPAPATPSPGAPDLQAFADAGMSLSQTARVLGKPLSTAHRWARKQGVEFMKDRATASKHMHRLHRQPAFTAAARERARQRCAVLNEDPQRVAERMAALRARKTPTPPKPPKPRGPRTVARDLAALSRKELADYRGLRKYGFGHVYALGSIGREDLCRAPAPS